ncbi:hypothetical protein [Actibacterium ureilyticum]|uniref:hypothetical protein n=1 Tax=Actibacterium ureilyticum TaxID=1590614 RepID=UPI000BAA9AC9|nr:hypothetical protein [Actibacterium ureilyticum]
MNRRYGKIGPRVLRPGKRLARGLREAAFDQDMAAMRDDLLAALAEIPVALSETEAKPGPDDARIGGAV